MELQDTTGIGIPTYTLSRCKPRAHLGAPGLESTEIHGEGAEIPSLWCLAKLGLEFGAPGIHRHH